VAPTPVRERVAATPAVPRSAGRMPQVEGRAAAMRVALLRAVEMPARLRRVVLLRPPRAPAVRMRPAQARALLTHPALERAGSTPAPPRCVAPTLAWSTPALQTPPSAAPASFRSRTSRSSAISEGEKMPIQFSGTLDPGQYREWVTWGWGREDIVTWSVRPSQGQIGTVSLRALATQAADDGSLSYLLTVWNVGTDQVGFDAIYAFPPEAQRQVIDDPSGDYDLAAGESIDLIWDLGGEPNLVGLVPVPQDIGTSFQCSVESVTANLGGTATYGFSVTNTGQADGSFRLRAYFT